MGRKKRAGDAEVPCAERKREREATARRELEKRIMMRNMYTKEETGEEREGQCPSRGPESEGN